MDTFRAAVKAALAGEGYVQPPSPMVEYRQYTVKPGDTLWNIARDHLGTGMQYKDIMALNNLMSDVIRIGQILLLPE